MTFWSNQMIYFVNKSLYFLAICSVVNFGDKCIETGTFGIKYCSFENCSKQPPFLHMFWVLCFFCLPSKMITFFLQSAELISWKTFIALLSSKRDALLNGVTLLIFLRRLSGCSVKLNLLLSNSVSRMLVYFAQLDFSW